ncbi:hypothetical protein [Bacillus aquiflavi]
MHFCNHKRLQKRLNDLNSMKYRAKTT